MKRRQVITLLGGAAAACVSRPLAARAQQPATPLVGFLGTSTSNNPTQTGFVRGLSEAGFVEGRNVGIEYRFTEGRYDRLPALVTELLERNVSVLFAAGGIQAALAAKPASARVPVVFANGSDPLRFGLVESLNRPGGNITGVSFFTATLEAKRLGLLSQLVPAASAFGVLANPINSNAESQRQDIEQGARVLGRPVDIVGARDEGEIESAFAALVQRRSPALLVASDPFFFSRREQIVRLAALHRLPAIYEWREFAEAGGLASYGTNLADAYRFAGSYVGRILKGEKPADLPVLQSSKFEFIINLRTARALGIEVPLGLSAGADEIIE
jgi:putative tryptophan/tyrosine transport system substrate-binding protein